MTGGYIPLDQLTDDQSRIIEEMIYDTVADDTLETISDERTAKLLQVARREGADPAEAGRLVGHFNAATRMIQQMTPEQKQQFHETLQRKLSPG